jgi:hypothetical protein
LSGRCSSCRRCILGCIRRAFHRTCILSVRRLARQCRAVYRASTSAQPDGAHLFLCPVGARTRMTSQSYSAFDAISMRVSEWT